MKIAPSILSADFAHLGEALRMAENGGADMIHVDVMDGHFVPNLTFGPPVIKSIRPHTALPFDVHLMISNPEERLKAYVDAGADTLTVHYETLGDHPVRVLEAIKAYGVKAGLSIKPSTTPDVVGPLFEHLDQILVMTVDPGFGGQAFMPEQLKKISILADWIKQSGKPIALEVDGGINTDTIGLCTQAGASIAVAGSAVYGAGCVSDNIAALRRAAEHT